jgi:hypothetical protein
MIFGNKNPQFVHNDSPHKLFGAEAQSLRLGESSIVAVPQGQRGNEQLCRFQNQLTVKSDS